MSLDDLVGRARAAAADTTRDPGQQGLLRLSGGMTHQVFAPEDDSSLVVKVFTGPGRRAADNEWDALTALAGSGVAPGPVRFDRDPRPVVVMEHVHGSSLAGGALGPGHASAIGHAHRLVQAAPVPRRRGSRPPSVLLKIRLALILSRPRYWRDNDSAELIAQAWRSARRWAADVRLDQLTGGDHPRFSRGDPNLTNYLWSGEDVVLIDWEDSGFTDPAMQLADMAEHPSARELADTFWFEVAAATELTPADLNRAERHRRAMACFWLVVIENRQRRNRLTTVTLEEQAKRTLEVLEKPLQ